MGASSVAFLAYLDPVVKTRFAADAEDERNWRPENFIVARDVGELGPAEKLGRLGVGCS